MWGHPLVVSLLLRTGRVDVAFVDMTVTDERRDGGDGLTALHVACIYGKRNVVQVLLENTGRMGHYNIHLWRNIYTEK